MSPPGRSRSTARKQKFRAERDAALTGPDVVALAQVRDHGEQINAFETRLLRLSMAMQDALTNIPETRLTQSAGRIEYTNILDTLMFDLPRLKKAILRVAALKQINDASAGDEARRALAQQTAAAGIDMLDKAYTKAKESQSGALAEIAAMGDIADRIVGIIDKGARSTSRTRASRAEAMRQLEGSRTNSSPAWRRAPPTPSVPARFRGGDISSMRTARRALIDEMRPFVAAASRDGRCCRGQRPRLQLPALSGDGAR